MRALLFLLLVTNLVVAGFAVLSHRQEVVNGYTALKGEQPLDNETIILLSEYQQSHGELQPLGQTERSSAVCTRLVGEWDSEQVIDIVQHLQGLDAQHLQQGTLKHARVSYWVTIPPQTDQAAAIAAKISLRKAKISDVFILKSGERKHALSLGLFSSEDAAIRRVRQVNQLDSGLGKAGVESITLYVDRPWIEYSLERPVVEVIEPKAMKGVLEQTQQRCSSE